MIKNNNQINKVKSQNGIKNASASGITLVALVVTIVVLLILAGITIAALFSDNGIIAAAQKAKTDTESAVDKTQKELVNLAGDLENVLKNNAGGKTNALPSTESTKPYLPTTSFKQVKGTSLENGLVISDNIENGVSTGNEYVWIEVPTTDEVYKITKSKKDVATLTDDDLKNIEKDLREYSKDYQKYYDSSNAEVDQSSYEDKWHSSLNDATNGKVVAIESESKYNELKNKMLKSVYQNGGFWIGRYEAGIETARTANTDTIADTLVPLSKANKEPLTYVTRNQAQMLASRVLEGHSSLMFGVQWDLVLKYLETKIGSSNLTDSNGKNILTQDSTSWGNYKTSVYTLPKSDEIKYAILNTSNWTLGNYNSVDTEKNKTTSDAWLLTTGAQLKQDGKITQTLSKQNIYDIAGNVYEWTLEYTSNGRRPCAFRGGSGGGNGSSFPASSRYYVDAPTSGVLDGLRLTLY